MLRYLILPYLCALCLFGQNLERPCSVTLKVVDYGGRPAPYRVATFRNRGGLDYARQFSGLRGTVPCGSRYEFRVVRIDVDNRHGDIVGAVGAWQAENWMTIVTDPNLFILGDKAGQV